MDLQTISVRLQRNAHCLQADYRGGEIADGEYQRIDGQSRWAGQTQATEQEKLRTCCKSAALGQLLGRNTRLGRHP